MIEMNNLSEYTSENINKKIKRKNIRSIIGSIIIYLLVIILSVYFVIILLGKISEKNNNFQINSFVVVSGSMIPTLNTNDLIFNIKVNEDELKKDNIISFLQDGNVVTHRINNIIQKDGKKYYETKGDNNNDIDENLVEYENIIGRYMFKIPKIGYLIRNMQTQIGILLIILVLLIREMFLRNYENKMILRHNKRLKREECEKSGI